MSKTFGLKLLGVICVLSLLIGALYVPMSFSAGAATIPVTDDETIVFGFEPEEDPITGDGDPENYSRAADGYGIAGWGLKPRTDGDVKGIGFLHVADTNYKTSGGYRLNNKDGVYNLEPSTTYVVSFKVRVKSTPLIQNSLTDTVSSVLRLGYGFTGVAEGASGNRCSTMHATVAEVVKATSIPAADKANGTFTLTTMAGSSEQKVGDTWHEVTYAFTTPDSFGNYAASLGFFSSCYQGTDFMIDDVAVTKLGNDKGAVVFVDEYYGTCSVATGTVDEEVALEEPKVEDAEYDFIEWCKDENRAESAEGITFANGVTTLYAKWDAPVSVTFVDTLNPDSDVVVTGKPGDTIKYPADPVDNVNEPDQQWFMGWYNTQSLTEKFTQTEFGYTNLTVYSKWQGEYATQVEDFENYTRDNRTSYDYDAERGNIYNNSFYFGTAMQKWDDPTNSGRGKVIAFPWDSSMVKDKTDRNSNPASYDAASFYGSVDNVVQLQNVKLEDGVTYTLTFDYYVKDMADGLALTIYPLVAHDSGIWSTKLNLKNEQSVYSVITSDDKDGEWHKAEMIFTMKYPATTSNVMHFIFALSENKDAVVYVDNFVFTPVQLNESLIIYHANNNTEKKIVTGIPGEKIPEYVPENSGLTFGGWYTDSTLTSKYEETVFGRGGVSLFAKWDGTVIDFVNHKGGAANAFPISFSVVNENGAGLDDDWAIKWHYDGDAVWVDEAKSLMYQRSSSLDHILALKTLEKGKTYQVRYWLNVEKATNDFNVQLCTTNPGYVWDPATKYGSTYQNISKTEAGKGWKQYTTLLTIDTDPNKQSGLYMGLFADKRTIDDDVVVYIDKVSIVPVETGAIIFNTGIAERDGDWQLGNVGDKIEYPVISGVRADLFDGWFADKECTVPYTYETIQEGIANVYAKWSGNIEEFIDRKKGSASTFGQAMYVENNKAGYEDDWAIKWHYDGDAAWSSGLMHQRGGITDHIINLSVLDKGTYEISYWLNVEKATNDFTVQFFTSNIGWVWDPNVTYGSSYKIISKDTAGKGWIRYSVMINVDTEKNIVQYDGRDTVNNNGLFMSLLAANRTKDDENIVYIDAVVIKPVDTAVIFDPQASSEGAYQKGKAGDTIKYPAAPSRIGYEFAGWFEDKDCTKPFTAKKLVGGKVLMAYAGYEKATEVFYDFENYNFSNPTGWFVWDEGGEVAEFDKACSGKYAARFNRDPEVCHGSRSGFTVVGHGTEAFTLDATKKYLVTFKYYVEKAGSKDATISFTAAHPTSYWHNSKSVSGKKTVSLSEKTGIWIEGALVLDGSKMKEPVASNGLFVVVGGGDGGMYYVDDINILTIPEGHTAYTVENNGCDSVPLYVMGKIGTSFVKQLPNAPTMNNHYFGGYSMYDANNNLSDLIPEKMVFSEDTIRIIANFVRIETKQSFEEDYLPLLNAYGDYSAIDFDYEIYDSNKEGNSKDNVAEGRYSLHRKGTTYHFENAQILTANKSLTPNQKYTITMKVKLGKHFHTDGAIKIGSCKTPYYPWSIGGDYFAIVAIKDLKEGEWQEVSFTYTAVEAFLSIQTPGYCELFIDDVTITRVDGTVASSKSVSYTEYVPAKRDADGNLLKRSAWDVSVESIIDSTLGQNVGGGYMIYIIIGGAALVLIAAAVVIVLLIAKKRKKKA